MHINGDTGEVAGRVLASLSRFERYSGLIFDMDGTLMDSGPLQELAWRATLAEYGLPVDAALMRSLSGVSTVATAKAVWAHFEVSETVDFAVVAAFKEKSLRSQVRAHVQPTPLVEIARHFRGRVPMSVGTGAHTAEARDILEYCGLLDLFAAVVGADQVERPKPAPDTFSRCAALMGVEPAGCVVFEDAELGLQAAAKAGMDGVDVGAEFGISYNYFLTD